MNTSRYEFLRLPLLFTFCFSLPAYGYRWLSPGFSGDAMQVSLLGEAVYQTSLGRFLQPIYWQVRGHLCPPLVIGLFATVFLGLSAAVIVRLLGLERPAHIALACGVLAASETLAASYASYLPWVDVYMLALLLSVLGVYALWRMPRGLLIAPVLFMLSLGLYQSYLPAASTLILLLLLLDTLRGEAISQIWRRGLLGCLALLLGLLLYALALRIALGAVGAQASQDYNGVGNVGAVPLSLLPWLLRVTYMTPLNVLFGVGPQAMSWHASAVPAALNGAIFLPCAAAALCALRARGAAARLTALFLVGMLPLGMNFIQFVSKGTASGLTIYAYCLLYLLPVALAAQGLPPPRLRRPFAGAISLLLGVLILLNVRNANEMAIRRDLEFASTTAAMARALDRAEQTQGYIPGETPVVLMGYLSSGESASLRPGFEGTSGVQGMRYTYGVSHESSAYWYLQTVLGEPINLVGHDERLALSRTEAAMALPIYPDAGCCQMIDGVLYLRLS